MTKIVLITTRLICILTVSVFLNSCTKKSSGSGNNIPSPDGSWKVTVITSGHCGAPAASKLITVTGGNFNSSIATFTASGCTETISITGTITIGNTKYIASGNEFLSGNCCNGGNGFYNFIDTSPASGTVTSNWGSMKFEKQ